MDEKKPPNDQKRQSSLSKWVIEKEKRSKKENIEEKIPEKNEEENTVKIVKETSQSKENDKKRK